MGGLNRRDVLRKSVVASAGSVLAVSSTASASESTVCVDSSNPDCVDTIQEGVNQVAPGGTVEVTPGVYSEQVFIGKSVTLRGDPGSNSPYPGADAPTLDGEGETKRAFVIPPGGEDVTITGFEIRNYDEERGGGRAVLAPRRTRRITITDNYIHNMGVGGIVSAPTGTHRGWRVERNTISDVPTVGIRLSNTSQCIVRRNVIEGTDGHGDQSSGSGFTTTGINIAAKRKDGGGQFTVEDLRIEDNKVAGQYDGAGIAVYSWNANKEDGPVLLRNVTIRENNVSGVVEPPGFAGVNLLTFNGAVMEDITVTSNDLSGNRLPLQLGHLRGEQGMHRNIRCTDNVLKGEYAGAGIFDISDSSVALRGNEIRESEYGVLVVVQGGQYVTVRGNNIVDNESAGLENETDTEIDAEENWWGAENGPERQAGKSNRTVGDGDRVRGKVDYRPWSSQEL